MGQKVNANAIRLNITREPLDRWYAQGKAYADYIHSHMKIRRYLIKKLPSAGISKIYIERMGKSVQVYIYAARSGVIIGKKGADIENLRRDLTRLMKLSFHLNIREVRKPDLDAKLVAESISGQLERRVMFRRAMKRAVQSTLRAGAKGVRICISGRLGGAEIASSKVYHEGRVPLHTFRADIDYGFAEAKTTYGIIGVKVWIFKGEVIKKGDHQNVNAETDKV